VRHEVPPSVTVIDGGKSMVGRFCWNFKI